MKKEPEKKKVEPKKKVVKKVLPEDKKEVLDEKKIVKKRRFKLKMDRQNIFVVVSLCILILIVGKIGFNSLYYYSKQNQKIKVEEKFLATYVKKNPIVKDGDGLYQKGQEYTYKGNVTNNYVKYSNQLFRIMTVYSDNSVRMIAEENQTNLVWGNDNKYLTSNPYRYLNASETAHTGIFYHSLYKPEEYLTKTKWCETVLENDKSECRPSNTSDYATLLTLEEYLDALGEKSYLNNGVYTWLMDTNEDQENVAIHKNGTIITANHEQGYGIRPIITFKDKVEVKKGTGTKDDPYIVEDETTMYHQYVKLGNDLYTIYEVSDSMIKLALTEPIKKGNDPFLKIYSKSNNRFDPSISTNIAYYLNRTFYNSLSYKNLLEEGSFYHGELSDETSYDYLNLFENEVKVKVGLLNSSDLKIGLKATSYFLLDKTSSFSENVYIEENDGRLVEAITKDEKAIVPTIMIAKDKIKGGIGSIDDPYRVE